MGSVNDLKQQTGLAVKEPTTFPKLLETMKPQIQMALPRHLNAERMIRIALTCWRMNPKLAECDPQSIIASIMIASQLGLEPGVMGQCYLIPYKNHGSQKMFCQLVPGWMGMVDLVNRSGKATAWTGAVYKGDEFDWALGDRPHVTHRPCGEDDPKLMTHVYAVGRTKASDWPIIEVWPVEKIWKHRAKINKVGDNHYSYKFQEMYARKVPLMQVLKYVPRSIELTNALTIDEIAETGGRQLAMKDAANAVIDGSAAIVSGEIGPGVEETPEFDEQKMPDVADAFGQKKEAAPAKKLDEICSCGGKNGAHEEGCKHATATAKHPPAWDRRNKALWAKATELGVPHDDVKQYAYETFKIDSCSKLTVEQIEICIAWVNETGKF